MNDKKSIHFVLPFSGRKPVGGFRVVYEYANELSARGHEVTITHAAGLYLGVNPNDRAWLNIAKYLVFGALRNYTPDRWFSLDPKVRAAWVPALHPIFIPKADIVIATSWETAEWVSRLPADRGKQIYLIQHFEDWHAPKERLLRTWKAIPNKIVISRWLEQIAHDIEEPSVYVPNGLNFDAFGLDVAPSEREPASILMLHHDKAFKGTRFGLAALKKIKHTIPSAKMTLFGTQQPPEGALPNWIHFECRPSPARLRELYNQHAIFISPSLSEGWALPPAEAMQCGCATVLTRIGGHEYAIDRKSSLLSDPKDIEAMVGNVLELITNNALRTRLALEGHREISQYTWPRATNEMLKLIDKVCANAPSGSNY